MEKHEFPAAVAAVISEARRQQVMADEHIKHLNAAVIALSAAKNSVQRDALKELRQILADASRSAADEIAEPWRAATAEANNASKVFQRAARFAPWRMFWLALACTILGILAMVFTAKAILPDWEELTALKQERAELEASIELLKSRGANVTLTRCNDLKNRKRLCAKTDDAAGIFPNDFHILSEHARSGAR